MCIYQSQTDYNQNKIDGKNDSPQIFRIETIKTFSKNVKLIYIMVYKFIFLKKRHFSQLLSLILFVL